MHWASWHDFWAMGGAAWFVWGAYGLAALALASEMLLIRARLKRARETVRRTSTWMKRGSE
jgi:heme exporter protein D